MSGKTENSSMSFPQAAQPDIVRAAQRDGSFVARLRGDLQDLVGQLFGMQATRDACLLPG